MNNPLAKGISRFIIYTINKLWLMLAAVIILIAVGFSLLRLFLPQISYFKHDIEAWVLSEYQARISIGQLDARWGEKGPVLIISDFQLLSPQQSSNLFSVENFSIHLDGLSSLVEQNFVTERIEIKGAKAHFILGRNLGLTINPLPSKASTQPESQDSIVDVESTSKLLLSTLFAQKHLTLSQSNINFQTLAGENFNYLIENLTIRNFDQIHQLSGKLSDEHQGAINLVAEIYGNPAEADSHTQLYLQGDAIKLSELPLFDNLEHLQPKTGKLNWQLWGEWRNNRWQSAQGDITLENIEWQKQGKETTANVATEQATVSSVKNNIKSNVESDVESDVESHVSILNGPTIAKVDSLSAVFNWEYLKQNQGVFSLNQVKLKQSELSQNIIKLPPLYLMLDQKDNFDLSWDLVTHNLEMQPLLSLFDVIFSSTVSDINTFQQSNLNLNFDRLGVRFLKQKGVWHLPKIYAQFSNLGYEKLLGLPSITSINEKSRNLHKPNVDDRQAQAEPQTQTQIQTQTRQNELKGISGELGFAYGAGFAKLNAKNIKLKFDSLFRQPLEVNHLQTAIGWQESDQQGFVLNINRLVATNGDLNLSSRGQFFFEQEKPVLSLYSELTELDVSKKSLYLPVGVMSNGLVEHLDTGVIDGKLSLVKAVMHGPLDAFPYENPQGVFAILGVLEQASYRYLPDWPQANKLDVVLLFEGNKMDLQASSAVSVGNRVNYARALIKDMSAAEAILELDISAQSFANSGQALLLQSPLKSLGQSLSSFDINGEIKTNLKIDMPLDNSEQIRVSGTVLPNKHNAEINVAGMTFNQLQGGIYFDQQGVNYSEVNAKYHELPIRASINPQLKPSELEKSASTKANLQQAELEIQVQGELNRSSFADFLGENWASFVTGKTKFDASILVSPQGQEEQTIIDVNSDFVGLSFDLPDELFKASADKTPFNFNLAIGEYSVALINWRKLKAQFLLNDTQSDNAISSGLFLYNQDKPLTLDLEEKITIDGRLGQVDLLAWQRLIEVGFADSATDDNKENILIEQSSKPTLPVIYDIKLEIDNIAQDVIALGKTKLQASNLLENNDWLFKVQSTAIDGELSLLSNKPSRLLLNHLALDYTPEYAKKLAEIKNSDNKNDQVTVVKPEVNDSQLDTSATTQNLSNENVLMSQNQAHERDNSTLLNQAHQWPRIDIDCNTCRVFTYNLGQLKAEVKPQQQGVNVKAVINQGKRLQAKINIDWLQSSSSTEKLEDKKLEKSKEILSSVQSTINSTQLEFEMSSDNFGRLMQQWQYPVGIEDSSSRVVAKLTWPSTPWSPDPKVLEGGASFSFGDGYLSELSDSKARLFSLLNIQSLGKRLTLDFKDIYKKGFFYERLSGDVGFSKGVYITDNVFIDGTAAKVTLSGEVDLTNNRIEQTALVIPQLTSSLPVLVGWAVEPTTGLLVYLLNKIMEPAIDVVSQIEYRIHGDLDQVKVDQVSQKKRRVKVEYPDDVEEKIVPIDEADLTDNLPSALIKENKKQSEDDKP